MQFTDLDLARIRIAFRVVGDCRLAGSDVYAWNSCLVHSLQTHLANTYTCAFAFDFQHGKFQLDNAQSFYELWEEPQYRAKWLEFLTSGELDRLTSSQRLLANYTGWRVARRSDLFTDEEWASCRERVELRHACNQDDFIFSACMMTGNAGLYCLSLNRSVDAQPYTQADRQFVELILEELVPLIGTELNYNSHCTYRLLPPRLRQVFELLMQSRTEKSIAATLQLSPHTVHEYVMELYRRFEVNRRSALLAAAYKMGWKPNQ